MIKAKGVYFGDGIHEIRPQEPILEHIPVQAIKYTQKARKANRGELSAREIAVLVSCFAPLCIGGAFLTVMLRHEAFYICYWLAVYAWWGFVIYANTKRVRRRHGNSKRTNRNLNK